jgi:hypothetical protein
MGLGLHAWPIFKIHVVHPYIFLSEKMMSDLSTIF